MQAGICAKTNVAANALPGCPRSALVQSGSFQLIARDDTREKRNTNDRGLSKEVLKYACRKVDCAKNNCTP